MDGSALVPRDFPTMERAAQNRFTDRFNGLVDWLYPPRCRACAGRIFGRDAQYFCAACWKAIRLVDHPFCSLCGRPFPDGSGDDHLCAACIARRPHFVQARAWACYPREEDSEQPLRRVVQQFKYGRKVALGKPLGRLMAEGCGEFLSVWSVDVVVPVPLHPQRLRWRGFNQSVLLGRQISLHYNVPLDAFALQRVAATPPQTQLTEAERRRNVRGAFELAPEHALEDKTVLLVDDVYTSGATVNECSRALLKGGAKEVFVLTLAHAV
ncbi:MAG: ComF family protein [Deltaproteobacteria bacterium]|nr:ComF family protein [Deltaproteobacteria bacterium]